MCFPSSYQAVDLPISRNPVFFLNKLFLLFLFLDSCCIPPRNVSDSVQFLSLLFCQQNPSLIHSPVDDVLRRSVSIQGERFDLVEIFSQVSVKSTFTSRVTTTSLNRKLTFSPFVSPSRNPDQSLMRGFLSHIRSRKGYSFSNSPEIRPLHSSSSSSISLFESYSNLHRRDLIDSAYKELQNAADSSSKLSTLYRKPNRHDFLLSSTSLFSVSGDHESDATVIAVCASERGVRTKREDRNRYWKDGDNVSLPLPLPSVVLVDAGGLGRQLMDSIGDRFNFGGELRKPLLENDLARRRQRD